MTNLSPIVPIISFSWNVNNLDTSSFIDVPDSSTWYIVEVMNSAGCIIKDSVFVNVYDYPIIDFVWASDSICSDSLLVFASFSPTVSAVFWSSNVNFTDTIGVEDSVFVFSSGTYYIKVINGVCEQIDSIIALSESINIEVFANDICRGDSTFVGVTNLNPVPITSYRWNVDTLKTEAFIIVSPDSSTWYTVEVMNSAGCIIKDSVFVNVYDCIDVFCDAKNLKIPTAFSPNNDGINDAYFIEDKDGIVTNFKLEIFNRLGQKVFEFFDINEKWDKEDGADKLSPQVFDFYLELECIGQKKLFHKGNITLIR